MKLWAKVDISLHQPRCGLGSEHCRWLELASIDLKLHASRDGVHSDSANGHNGKRCLENNSVL